MSNNKKKILAFVLTASILSANINSTYAVNDLNRKLKESKDSLDSINDNIKKESDKIDSYKMDIERNKSSKDEVNKTLEDLQEQELTLEDQIQAINGKIQNTLDKIYSLESDILDMEANIEDKENKIEILKDKIYENTELLNERLVVMYKMGDAGKMEILLTSQDINDFLSRNKMMTSITEYDQNLIKTLKQDKTELDKLVLELKGEKKALEIAKENTELERDNLQKEKEVQNVLLDKLKKEESENYTKLAELEDTITKYEDYLSEKLSEKSSLEDKKVDIQKEINNLESEIQKEIEREKREKERIAREKRQEEQRRKERLAQQQRLERLQNKRSELKSVEQSISNFRQSSGRFTWPTDSYNITSHFGYRIHPIFGRGDFHNGLDLAGPIGTSIYAADSGVVTSTPYTHWGGNMIIISHGNGLETRYLHLSGRNVSPGQTVQRGQRIGSMGSTGDSTGSHLHFEVREGGSPKNPLNYLR